MKPGNSVNGIRRPAATRASVPRPDAPRAGKPRAMTSNAPLLTVVACAMGAFFVLKIGDIAFNSDPAPMAIGAAVAQENEADPAKADDQKAEDAAKTAAGENAEDPEKKAAMDAANADAANATPAAGASTAPNATKTEIEVIERLAERRKQLEARDSEIDLREKLLKAAEQKLQKKLAELKQIEARIEAAFAKEKKERSDEFMGLVSLYENMKPKRAARIFDKLDMDILLSVAQKMKTRKMSAILAQMNAEVAQRLTVELVARVSGGKMSGDQQLPGVVERNPG